MLSNTYSPERISDALHAREESNIILIVKHKSSAMMNNADVA